MLPETLVAFLLDSVAGADHLDVLMVLMNGRSRWWDARMLAAELGLPEPTLETILEALAGRNLLDVRLTDSIRYQFRPGTPALSDMARCCGDWYRRQPSALFEAVSTNAVLGAADGRGV